MRQPGKLGKYLWMGGFLVAAGVCAFFLTQVGLSYSSKASRAVEDGKRVIIAAETGEVTQRGSEKPMPAATIPSTSISSDTPDAPAEAVTPEPVPEPGKEASAATPDEIGPQLPKEQATEPEKQPEPGETAATPEGTSPKPEEGSKEAASAPIEIESAPALPAGATPESIVPPAYNGKARLVVIITGMGLDHSLAEAAARLPPGVALSFSPYSNNLEQWIQSVRKVGHQALLDLPLEPEGYPLTDPGPLAILNDASKEKNLFRLKSLLTAAKDYTAVLAPEDETVTRSLVTALPLIDGLHKQGTTLIYNEKPANASLRQDAESVGLSIYPHFMVADETLSQEAIDGKLEEARKAVMEEGQTVLVVGHAYPLTVKRISAWLKKLHDAGLDVSPVSSVIVREDTGEKTDQKDAGQKNMGKPEAEPEARPFGKQSGNRAAKSVSGTPASGKHEELPQPKEEGNAPHPP